MILLKPDRGYNINFGWFDKENMLPVITSQSYGYIKDGITKYRYESGNRNLRYSYASFPIEITTSNNNKYWVFGGYSYDGHKFRTYHSGLTLHTEGYIIFGSFTLDDNSNITHVKIENLIGNVFEPNGTRFEVFLSTDNGTNWEPYNWKSVDNKKLLNIGSSLKIKFNLIGFEGILSPYILSLSLDRIVVIFSNMSDISDNYLIKKIQGS
jgi:hypothetical protein